MTNYTFKTVTVTSNKKLGPIAASYTSANSCPDSCPLKSNGCYAETGPTAWQWKKTENDFQAFIGWINSLNKGAMFRHNVAGDLPSTNGGMIDQDALGAIVAASEARKLNGFTYTHHLPENSVYGHRNADILVQNKSANFVVNLSANNIDQAIDYKAFYPELPVVTVVPSDFWQGEKGKDKTFNMVRVSGRHVIRCPAEYQENITCSNCKACANGNRNSIIAFTAHGARKKKASIIAKG